jgi:hypothetical protein
VSVREPARSAKDRPVFRLAALLIVLLAAFIASHSCADSSPAISKDAAIEVARSVQDFTPDQVQVRFVQEGAPSPRGVWAVSMYQGTASNPTRVQVVTVDAQTGVVLDASR